MSLTQNGVHRLVNLNEFENDSNFRPTFQVLRVIAVNAAAPNGEQKTRYRVILSDGIHHCQGMLATQNNNRVTSGEVVDHVLLKINDCLFNNIQNKALVIVLGFDVIGDNPGVKIGTPTDIGVPIGSKNKGQGQGQGQGQGGNGNNGNNGNGGNMPQAQQPVRANIKPENAYSNNNHNNNSYNNNNRQNNNSYGNNNNNNNNNSYGNNNNRNSNPYGSTSSGSIIRTTTPSSTKPITPISQLNMYQNRWTIKARITSKSQIRTWSNTKGEGKLFSLELLDENCDIRSTFFKEAVDKFYDMLQVNTVYTFSGGRLKAANMQYNTCKSSFEITFDQNAEIVKADDDGMILQQSYTLVPIASLENTEPGGYVDVMGVVKRVGEPGTIMSKKTGRELSKCEVTIGDDSGADVSVTIWGEKAMTAPNDFANNPIVAFRRARLSDYGGRTLSANGDGINIRPNVPEAEKLLEWWNTGGKSQNGQAKSLSSSMGGGANRFPKFEDRKSIASIKGENLGYTSAEKPDWISFKGTFNFIKSDREGGAWYSACPNPNDPCKSRCKVTMAHEGSYMCDRCNQSFESCLHRYIFSATISDDTSTTWVSVFDDQAKVLLNGKTADELHEILNGEGGQSDYDGHFARAHFTDWVFTCKVKQEMNQDEMRIKTTIQSIHPMDYAKEGNSLLNSILSM